MTIQLAPQPQFEMEDHRVLLSGVSWSTYVMLSDSIDSKNVQMTYLEGLLEIVTKGGLHEVSKKQIARLVELFCLERDIPLYAFGETTERRQAKKRGLEPDEWYSRYNRDLPAEIALEVVVTNPLLNKLEVYRGLGTREVWVFYAKLGVFKIFALRDDRYEQIAASEVIPEIDFARIAHYLTLKDQHEALKAFRDELRGDQK